MTSLDARHILATIAYRLSKVVRDAPPDFAAFRSGDGGPTAGAILSHVADLFSWTSRILAGDKSWNEHPGESWEDANARCFAALQTLDGQLAAGTSGTYSLEQLFQGPLSDSLTHVGQLAMLRRMAGAPTIGENYVVADIKPGVVGIDQPPPRRPFT